MFLTMVSGLQLLAHHADAVDTVDLPKLLDNLMIHVTVHIDQCVGKLALGLVGHVGNVAARGTESLRILADHVGDILMEDAQTRLCADPEIAAWIIHAV